MIGRTLELFRKLEGWDDENHWGYQDKDEFYQETKAHHWEDNEDGTYDIYHKDTGEKIAFWDTYWEAGWVLL